MSRFPACSAPSHQVPGSYFIVGRRSSYAKQCGAALGSTLKPSCRKRLTRVTGNTPIGQSRQSLDQQGFC